MVSFGSQAVCNLKFKDFRFGNNLSCSEYANKTANELLKYIFFCFKSKPNSNFKLNCIFQIFRVIAKSEGFRAANFRLNLICDSARNERI